MSKEEIAATYNAVVKTVENLNSLQSSFQKITLKQRALGGKVKGITYDIWASMQILVTEGLVSPISPVSIPIIPPPPPPPPPPPQSNINLSFRMYMLDFGDNVWQLLESMTYCYMPDIAMMELLQTAMADDGEHDWAAKYHRLEEAINREMKQCVQLHGNFDHMKYCSSHRTCGLVCVFSTPRLRLHHNHHSCAFLQCPSSMGYGVAAKEW